VIDHPLLQSSGLIGQPEQATTADLVQDKVLEETLVDDVLILSSDQSRTHQKVDASVVQLQGSITRADPLIEDPIGVSFLLTFSLIFSMSNPLSLFRMWLKFQLKPKISL
jgi:hypothetical protein